MNASQYFMHLSPAKVAGGLVSPYSNVPRPLISEWVANGAGVLTWQNPDGTGASSEFMSTANGFCYMTGYGDAAAGGMKYPVTSIATDYVDLETGYNAPLPAGLAWYAPLIIPRNGFMIRQWGDCLGTKWFWESRFFPGQSVANPCWINGPTTKAECIQQTECWYWADSRGWAVGNGGNPFAPDGTPRNPNATYGYDSTFAPDIGLWTHKTINPTANEVCLYSRWNCLCAIDWA